MATDRAPKSAWCFFCRQAIVFGDLEARRMANDEWLCGRCWEKADVGPDLPLDMMEDADAQR